MSDPIALKALNVAADAKAVGEELAKRLTTTEANQQLVTDADGNAVWEDKTHYKATRYEYVMSTIVPYGATSGYKEVVLDTDATPGQIIPGHLYKVAVYDAETGGFLISRGETATTNSNGYPYIIGKLTTYIHEFYIYQNNDGVLYLKYTNMGSIQNGAAVKAPIRLVVEDVIVDYTTLDEKYIPDTIARTADIPSVEGLASEEYVDSKIAQPDWNQNDETAADYVKNRTHYIEKKKTLVAEVSLAKTTLESMGTKSYAFDPSFMETASADAQYTMVIDGMEYELAQVWVGTSLNRLNTLGVKLSDGTSIGGVYLFPNTSQLMIDGAYGIDISAYTVFVYEATNVVKTIDPKYIPSNITIPAGGSLTIEEGATVVDNAGVLGGSGGAFVVTHTLDYETGETSFDSDFETVKAKLMACEEVVFKQVAVMGELRMVEFESFATRTHGQDTIVFFCIGNASVGTDGIPYGNLGAVVLASDGTITHHTGDTNFGSVYVRGSGGFFLHSNTPGSEKMFRVTVDDSGTLTATEI